MDISPLATAILLRSEQGLLSAISNYPGAVYEKTFGMTVLHLSSPWAAGLRILLEYGARELVDDCSPGVSALNLAVLYRSLESVQVLLDNDCSWHSFPHGDLVSSFSS